MRGHPHTAVFAENCCVAVGLSLLLAGCSPQEQTIRPQGAGAPGPARTRPERRSNRDGWERGSSRDGSERGRPRSTEAETPTRTPRDEDRAAPAETGEAPTETGATPAETGAAPAEARPADTGGAPTAGSRADERTLQPARSLGASSAGYHDHAGLSAALREIADASGGRATLESITRSHEGRDVWALTIAGAGELAPQSRPALLIVGGVDADYPLGSETALLVARRLVSAMAGTPDGPVAAMLTKRTVYVLPRVNPDGAERFFAGVRDASRLNRRPVDQDRDGVADEDGPNDLNGDGQISVIRVRDPRGAWMIDADEPRLMKKADATKNERGVFKLILEGRDDDDDGQIDEDPAGGVDHDRNWPHLFESGVAEAGIHQLCEPENRALADFVLARPNISAALVYGRHDNVVSVPKGADRGPDGQSYRDLHPDDVKTYEFLSEKYRKTTGLRGSNGTTAAGALYAWLYSQEGIPTFATSPWWPIERDPPTSQPASGAASEPADGAADNEGPQPASAAPEGAGAADALGAPPLDRSALLARIRAQLGESPTPEQLEAAEQGMRRAMAAAAQATPQAGQPTRTGRGGRRGGGPPRGAPPGGGGGSPQASAVGDLLAARVESTKNGKAWLKYSDEQLGGAGFVAWSEFDHPTLGKVEIGGLAPYFDAAAPAGELDDVADRQVQFLGELSDLLAAPRFGSPRVTAAGGGLWQVELRLINDGYLPTNGGMARHLRLPGWAVRPLAPERIVGGRRMERGGNLDGGGAATFRWLMRGDEGESVSFVAHHRAFGDLTTKVTLRATAPGQENQP